MKNILVVGSLNLDLVASVRRFPEPGETITGLSFERHTGGKGVNQAVAAALAGGSAQMIGRHGSDGFELPLLATLREAGVDVSRLLVSEGSSGVALILVAESGQNNIVVVPGANGRLSTKDLEVEREQFAEAGSVLTQLETPVEVLIETLRLAAESRTPVMLDPAPVAALGPEILRDVTWLTPNETEAAVLSGAGVPDETNLAQYAEKLLALGPKNLLLKLGARGAFVATKNGIREHVAGHRVDAVDTTAAGDALNGAMAAALMRGADAVEAARFGVAAAAISVTRRGASPSLARWAEIEEFRRR